MKNNKKRNVMTRKMKLVTIKVKSYGNFASTRIDMLYAAIERIQRLENRS